MKIRLLLPFFLFLSSTALCQLASGDYKSLQQQEDSMKSFALNIVRGRSAGQRVESDSIFTRMLVKALKTPFSFNYPFDSLITISRIAPQDSSFRIFTWQLMINEATTRLHGAIQMRTKDGSLKLFPLIDRSPLMETPDDTIGSNLNWVGALYYNIVENSAFGKKYYTLLGYDENDLKSSRKIIEMLTFRNGTPVFGGNNFSFPDSKLHKKGMARYIMTYKKDASPKLNYDPKLKMIVMEHLVSESGEPDKKYTYIPDGDYEGLKWKDGKWVYITKIFTQITPEGKEPVPVPILDNKGNADPAKLKNKSN